MKMKLLGMLLCLALLTGSFAGIVSPAPVAAAATTSLTITKYAPDGITVLEQVTKSLADLQAMPIQGDGTTHYFSQGPTFDPNNLWDPGETVNLKDKGAVRGTDIKDLCNLVGGAAEGDSILVKAADGYNDRFEYANVYNPAPQQGKMVVAWYTKAAGDPPQLYPGGAFVPEFADGMQLVFLTESTNASGQHVFGHQKMHDYLPEDNWHWYWDNSIQYPSCNGLSIKNISEIAVITGGTTEWNLELKGAMDYAMSQREFENGVSCTAGGHGVTYTDVSGTWAGLPLWTLCGWVDDDIVHGPGSFNDELAAAGYSVKVTAGDGYSYTFTSTEVARNQNIIVANSLNDLPLPQTADPGKTPPYPLKLVGSFAGTGWKVGNIVKIELLNLPITQYTLTVTTAGNGSVAKVPDQVTYDAGSSVQLTAAADPGWFFCGWSGDLSGSSNPATMVMNGEKLVTATFTQNPVTHTLTVTTMGSGAVTKSPDWAAYPSGSSVQLAAVPMPGYAFGGWSGDFSGTANPATVIMDADKAIMATFTQSTEWSLALSGANSYAMSQTEFEEGVNCTVHGVTWVDPANGNVWKGLPLWLLCGWVDDDVVHGFGAFNDALAAAGYDVKITAGDAYSYTFTGTLNSVFLARNNGIIVANTLNGAPLSQTGDPGKTPPYPLKLVGPALTSGGQKVGNLVKIELLGLPAVEYTLTVTTAGSGSVAKVPDQASYQAGASVQLTATASPGWSFSGWIGDLSGSTNPASVTMDSNKQITATFTQQAWNLQLDGMSKVTLPQSEFETMAAAFPVSWVNGADTWSGVALWRLVGKVDDVDPATMNSDYAALNYNISLIAGDSYTKKYGSAAVLNNDNFIIANKLNGQPLAQTGSKPPYPLKLVGPGLTSGQMVSNIAILQFAIPWSIQLNGASTYTMTNTEFESMVAANPASWAQDANNTWNGLALWRLIAKVDDDDPETFNDFLAAIGYNVRITASDGYNKTFSIADLERNDDRIIANGLNGYTLAPERFPLRFVGPGLTGGQMVSKIVKVELLNLPLPVTYSLQPSWNMISLPVTPTSTDPNVVFSGLPSGWLMYAWDAANGMYIGKNQIVLGLTAGFWLKVPAAVEYTVFGQSNGAAQTGIDLSLGWNLIGVPYAGPIPWEAVRVSKDGGEAVTLDQAATSNWIQGTFYCWSGNAYQVLSVGGIFQPLSGYWVKAKTAGLQLVLPKP